MFFITLYFNNLKKHLGRNQKIIFKLLKYFFNIILYLQHKTILNMKFLKNIWKVFIRIISNKKVVDSGMRTDSSGNIYVDNKVFFKREDVKETINKLIEKHELINK